MDLEESGRQLGGSGTNINLVAAASGSGHGGGCPEGIPVELGLLSILAAFGVAFGVLYMALTLTTAGRRKRSSDGFEPAEDDDLCETDSVQELIGCGLGKLARQAEGSLSYKFADLVWHGEQVFFVVVVGGGVEGLMPHIFSQYFHTCLDKITSLTRNRSVKQDYSVSWYVKSS